MTSPIIGPRQLVHENPFQQIFRVPVNFGGHSKEYFVREDGKHVGLVVVRDDSVLLVRQYRLLINDLSWEIPGGGIDEGEQPEEAAVRECLEETGISCRNIKPVIRFHLGLDTIHNPSWVFYADEFSDTGIRCNDPGEVVDYQWVAIDDCMKMIFSQQISGSFTIVALLGYQTLRNNGQLLTPPHSNTP